MNEQTPTTAFLDYWLETIMRDTLRKTSFAAYRGYIDNHIAPAIGVEPLCSVTPQIIQTLVRTLSVKKLANRTIRSIMAMVKTALDYAIEYEFIDKNPCRKMKLPKPKVAYEIKTFSLEELMRIEFTALYGYDDRYFGVLVSLYAGLRIGEICALKYKDIDFETGRLTVSRSLKRVLNHSEGQAKSSVIEEEPKTPHSLRTIPIPHKLCDMLRARQKTARSDYVICMESGKYCEPRTFQFVYERLLEESDVEYRNHHCCRHTFVTRCLELGGDIKTISELVGHSGVSVTLSVYAHSQMQTKERLMDKLNGQIFNYNNEDPKKI